MEFIQYQTGRRVADVDDFILNTIGFYVGLSLWKYLSKKSKSYLIKELI